MRVDRPSHTTQLLQLLIAAAVVLPVSLFLYLAWAQYRSLDAVATERVERTLDVLQEHALRVFQTIDRTIAETGEVVRGLPDDEIRAREQELHLRLQQTQLSLPQIEAIWLFDRTGRPLLASTIFPLPADLNNADRDYFRAHVAQEVGTYIGDVLTARIGDQVFFVVSRRRTDPAGAFNGVLAVTVPPTSLKDFYARIAQGTALSAGLIRSDGTFLARYPSTGSGVQRLGAGNRFVAAIATGPTRAPTRRSRRSTASSGGSPIASSRAIRSTFRRGSRTTRSGESCAKLSRPTSSSAFRQPPSSWS
jgi:two-component system NtrC family sensor kinase